METFTNGFAFWELDCPAGFVALGGVVTNGQLYPDYGSDKGSKNNEKLININYWPRNSGRLTLSMTLFLNPGTRLHFLYGNTVMLHNLCSPNVNGPLWAPKMTKPKNSVNHLL